MSLFQLKQAGSGILLVLINLRHIAVYSDETLGVGCYESMYFRIVVDEYLCW